MIYNNVLEAMGHTPMIRLNHMGDPDEMCIRDRMCCVTAGWVIFSSAAARVKFSSRAAQRNVSVRESSIQGSFLIKGSHIAQGHLAAADFILTRGNSRNNQ